MNPKIYQYLGLAKKSGNTVSGMDGVLASVRSGKSKLVVLAEDASENTKKQLTDKCRYYGVQVILFGTKESLSNSIGAAGLVSALSVTDRNLAGAILQSIL